MEPLEAFSDEEWDSLDQMFSNMDDPQGANNIAILDHEISLFTSNVFTNSNSYPFYSQEDISVSQCLNITPNEIDYVNQQTNNSPNQSLSMEFYIMNNNNGVPIFSDEAMKDILNPISGNADSDQPKKILASSGNQKKLKRKIISPPEDQELISKKKTRVKTQKSKQNVQERKNKKIISDVINENDQNETINAGKNMRSSNPSMCEDNSSNASEQEIHKEELINGGQTSNPILGSNVKTKATDSQSIYARKRREMINEKLKVLQNLVPNGTKVDISTMLEEAVQYVKFLQLQIKLLSSDDLWMYAPMLSMVWTLESMIPGRSQVFSCQ